MSRLTFAAVRISASAGQDPVKVREFFEELQDFACDRELSIEFGWELESDVAEEKA